jgi:hypothetical protein
LIALSIKGEIKPETLVTTRGAKEWVAYKDAAKNWPTDGDAKPGTARVGTAPAAPVAHATTPTPSPTAPQPPSTAEVVKCPYCNVISPPSNRCPSCGASLASLINENTGIKNIINYLKVDLPLPNVPIDESKPMNCPKCKSDQTIKLDEAAANQAKAHLAAKVPLPKKLTIMGSFKMVPSRNWYGLVAIVAVVLIYESLLSVLWAKIPEGLWAVISLPSRFTSLIIIGYVAYIIWDTMNQYNNKVHPAVYRMWASKRACEGCGEIY